MNRRAVFAKLASIAAVLLVPWQRLRANPRASVIRESAKLPLLVLDKVEAHGYFIDAEHARGFLSKAPIRIVQSQTHGARAQVLVSYWADLAHTDLKDDVAVTSREDFVGDVEAIRERFIKRVRFGARVREAGGTRLTPQPLFSCIKCYSDG